jgi:hypothetical protein
MYIGFENSFKTQVEILPRLTFIYGGGDRIVSLEFLFWVLFIDFNV